ncbi:MAG: DUF2779 domain-containing protein [Chitinophagaceae bacterium]|nr:DUF2779 domain-containing protein [Chitinophagaceae bacterium]
MNFRSSNLSKSRFVSGVQCSKKLYFDIYRKDLKPALTASQEALFNAGHDVGELAQTLFPNGKDATPINFYDFSLSIENTKKWIQSGEPTIYEAAFLHNGFLAALDILHHQNNELWAIEVKSSTSVKDYHITDASFQYWLMCKDGFTPDKFFLMHINSQFIKKGAINPKELFYLEDITEQVKNNLDWVETKAPELYKLYTDKTEPTIKIGTHCNSPFECDYKHHCWAHVPENSVFELSSARGKDWELYEEGIVELKDIPVDLVLNHRQQLQVNGAKTGVKYIDTASLKTFVDAVEYPLYFFDFETISTAIPFVDGTKPFQQLPFQYSLHVVNEQGLIEQHHEFLATPTDFVNITSKESDPRYQLIQQLKQQIGPKGNLVVYYSSFEINRFNELIAAFPEEKTLITDWINRCVDLIVPFKNAWYYLPAMGGSASIKDVLPAIAPEFSYSELEIQNGGDASEIYLSMIKNNFKGDAEKTKQNLLKYCERDTEGMVIIWNELLRVIKEK